MRKWVVIGVVVIAMATTVALIVAQSTERSIKYHSRKYLDAVHGPTKSRMREIWCYITRQPINKVSRVLQDEAEMEFHQKALVRLGGLQERTFVISYGDVSDVMPFANPMFSPQWARGATVQQPKRCEMTLIGKSRKLGNIARIRSHASNLVIIATPTDMRSWEECVKSFDTPPRH